MKNLAFAAAFAVLAFAAPANACEDPFGCRGTPAVTKATTTAPAARGVPVAAPKVAAGKRVHVRVYRGAGGAFFSFWGYDRIGPAAAAQCGVVPYIASRFGGDNPPAASKLIIVGASMGGKKARDVAVSLDKRKVDLLVTVDPVPWTGAIPKNVVRHINWRNTAPLQLGGGRPAGTHIDRPRFMDHVGLINSGEVFNDTVREICKLAR